MKKIIFSALFFLLYYRSNKIEKVTSTMVTFYYESTGCFNSKKKDSFN